MPPGGSPVEEGSPGEEPRLGGEERCAPRPQARAGLPAGTCAELGLWRLPLASHTSDGQQSRDPGAGQGSHPSWQRPPALLPILPPEDKLRNRGIPRGFCLYTALALLVSLDSVCIEQASVFPSCTTAALARQGPTQPGTPAPRHPCTLPASASSHWVALPNQAPLPWSSAGGQQLLQVNSVKTIIPLILLRRWDCLE